MARHEVKDFDTWNSEFKKIDDLRQECGEISVHLFRDLDNPNMVTIVGTWESMAHIEKYQQRPEIPEAMQKSGVMGDVQFHVMNEA